MRPLGEQNNMRIGIVGAGKVGGGLGKIWVRAGHQVLFSSRPNRLKVLIEEGGPGAYRGTIADAALFGDVILFSPNFWCVRDALEGTGLIEATASNDETNQTRRAPMSFHKQTSFARKHLAMLPRRAAS